ncbi:PREDICTED: putative GATA transcription factor 22 [Nelumbo nucifera]|uniref:GATA transcription factor 22 n=2 Tax=Nelumbo nucifera TaxID=4432 RepID=A0A1U8AAB1_NELNU|nr:PREDICTED: putative GATA transcription factor 22 [Nelumbo nucifera]DAD44437.1 TPA_asm: hypothetical protein HUJ06_002667 [Nelumbo nucifera]
MNPIYLNLNLNPSLSSFPLVEPNDEDQQYCQLFSPPPSQTNSSLHSTPLSFNSAREGGSHDHEAHDREQQEQQQRQEADKGSEGYHLDFPYPPLQSSKNGINSSLELSIKQEIRDESQSNSTGSARWMSSKMRLMRKMMNSDRMGADKPASGNTQKFQDHHQQPSSLEMDSSSSNSSSNNSNITVRVCSDCNTTKTPLWRSGPRGPKSLCNACGIRQRKARRAMAAAAASGTLLPADTPSLQRKVHHKEKRSETGYVPQYKKRCKLAPSPRSRKKLCFEDFTINLSKNSAFHRVFPQDEKEAAILLMALSCGLVHG